MLKNKNIYFDQDFDLITIVIYYKVWVYLFKCLHIKPDK